MGDRRSVTLFTALLAIPCLAQPPGIVYSTTVPYSGMTDNDGFSIYPNYPGPGVSLVVTDASGNSYVAGAIASTGLPTTPGVYQTQYAGGTCGYGEFSGPCPSVFIAKFNSTGALVFLTYLGGTYSSIPYGLAVDESGNIYVGVQAGVAYVAKLSADGTGLGWVTFLSSGILPQLAIAPDGSLYCLTEAALTKLNQSGQIVPGYSDTGACGWCRWIGVYRRTNSTELRFYREGESEPLGIRLVYLGGRERRTCRAGA